MNHRVLRAERLARLDDMMAIDDSNETLRLGLNEGEDDAALNAAQGASLVPFQIPDGPAAAESMGVTYEALLDWFAQDSATKRLVTVEDCANVASLLVSDAGAGITGSMISIDGGTAPY